MPHRHSILSIRSGGCASSMPLPAGAATGYAPAHAGRQLRLGPIAFRVTVGTLVIVAVSTARRSTR